MGLGGAGLRLRSGAFAPDCPVVILVAASGGCLRIPSGASDAPPPQAHATPGFFGFSFAGAGANWVLEVLANSGVVVVDLAGPAPGRPRGRPSGAYAVSCVVAMTLCVWLLCGWVLAAGFVGSEDLALLAPGRPRGRPRGLWRCLAIGDAAARLREISLALPAPKRPPGRPFGAYAVSCVVPMTLRVWRRAIWVLTQISHSRTPPSAMGAGVPQHMDKTSSSECLAPIRRWSSSSSPRGEVSATGRQAAQPIVNSTPSPLLPLLTASLAHHPPHSRKRTPPQRPNTHMPIAAARAAAIGVPADFIP